MASDTRLSASQKRPHNMIETNEEEDEEEAPLARRPLPNSLKVLFRRPVVATTTTTTTTTTAPATPSSFQAPLELPYEPPDDDLGRLYRSFTKMPTIPLPTTTPTQIAMARLKLEEGLRVKVFHSIRITPKIRDEFMYWRRHWQNFPSTLPMVYQKMNKKGLLAHVEYLDSRLATLTQGLNTINRQLKALNDRRIKTIMDHKEAGDIANRAVEPPYVDNVVQQIWSVVTEEYRIKEQVKLNDLVQQIEAIGFVRDEAHSFISSLTMVVKCMKIKIETFY